MSNRTKRQADNKWKEDEQIYIAWNQEPVGVPDAHSAISEHWIKTGQGVGPIRFVGTIYSKKQQMG